MTKLINPTVLLLSLGLLIWNPYPFKILELSAFDYLMSKSPTIQNENILLVDLDEEIVEAYGGYPLPRSLFASMIENTEGVSGLTLLMPDPDLRDNRNDYKLASAMSVRPTVLAYTASTQATESGPHVGTAQLGENPLPWLLNYQGILRQLPVLQLNAGGVGLINSSPELDGVVRRMPVAVSSGDKIYPSFALEMLRLAVGDPSYQIKTNETGVEWLRVPSYPTITTDANARIWVQQNVKFHRQTASQYMQNPIPAPFVIFGVTAEGVTNPVPTAQGAVYPHEIQANVLHSLIEGNSPSIPTWSVAVELGAALLALLLLWATASRIWLSLPILIITIGGLIYFTLEMWKSSYLVDVSGTILVGFLFWSIITFRNFITQFLLRLQIKQQFGTYVSPALVKKLQDDPTLLRLGGETKRLTFLFSDIRGFTPISEKYQKDPQGLTHLINRFLDNQTEIILKHEGTIDKYMGDCIMAFWNAPLDVEEQERKATECAIEMRIALGELNEKLREEGLDEINTGAGINTGPCVVGNFGSSTRFDYSVLGDAVNLAARLESSCKEYDADLIISEHSLVDGFDYEFLAEVTVKGKTEPVKIYTIRK
ncbi:adenylate/guanylate cyclase domain-containing protein [Gammaproteobacteria bacterium]|nr:adenylate/guanylate cyclase domain-containing protein [Gammaproteobacteria bacterium]